MFQRSIVYHKDVLFQLSIPLNGCDSILISCFHTIKFYKKTILHSLRRHIESPYIRRHGQTSPDVKHTVYFVGRIEVKQTERP